MFRKSGKPDVFGIFLLLLHIGGTGLSIKDTFLHFAPYTAAAVFIDNHVHPLPDRCKIFLRAGQRTDLLRSRFLLHCSVPVHDPVHKIGFPEGTAVGKCGKIECHLNGRHFDLPLTK